MDSGLVSIASELARLCIIPMRPRVWWYVEGRKMFATSIPVAIRRSWKVGRYERRRP